MNDKLIEVMAKAVVYTCMVLAGAALIFMFAAAAVAALRFMLGVLQNAGSGEGADAGAAA